MRIRVRLAFSVFGFVLAAAGCVKSPTYRGPAQTSGTCEGACHHYMSCKRLESSEVFRACVIECQEIFVEDGEPDRATLRDFERLRCDHAVAFVEGKNGRVPGE